MTLDRMRDLREDLAGILKQTRLLHNMTQEDLGLIINCRPEQIDGYENAAESISAVDLYIIAKSLNIPIENFFVCHDLVSCPLQEALEHNAYGFLKIFSEIEDPDLRKKVLEMCELYEELHATPLCA